MKKAQSIFTSVIVWGFISVGSFAQNNEPAHTPCREQRCLDRGWKFHLGDACSSADDFNYNAGRTFGKAGQWEGVLSDRFIDTSWRTVDLPHDWAVELDFVKSDDQQVLSHGFKPVGGLFPHTSIGWYRRSLEIPASDSARHLELRFDGVYRDCDVWFNGHFMGNNLSGYSGFSFDVTDYALPGRENLIVVRVDAGKCEGWFYEGAGIYRHVWLVSTGRLHVPEYGVFIQSRLREKRAAVFAETTVNNTSDKPAGCSVTTLVFDKQGRLAGTSGSREISVAGYGSNTLMQEIAVDNPNLWSPDTPYLYTAVTMLKVAGRTADSLATSFGIRSIHFDKDKGFFMNGKHMKIKGVCCHQDHAGVGSALPDRLQYYRIEKLKEMGANAYRTSHNPPTPELLDACDRLGLLVMDETRSMGSCPEFMSQLERLVLRDRNHPSVVLWSIGNEEGMIQNEATGRNIALAMLRKLRTLDTSRTCTYGADNGARFEGINSVIPVRGFNYMNHGGIDQYRREHPDQPLIGTEDGSTLCTRGIYENDTIRGYVSDYDTNAPWWGSTAEAWYKFCNARDFLAGSFVWTGFDYRGEPTPYGWPCINSHFGIMDVCGFPKNNFYYYKARWTDEDVLHLAPHWNWKGKEGEPVSVWCQTNCESVELFLNGKSLGRKVLPENSHLEWKVPYTPGTLEARGIRHSRKVTARVETTGEPAAILLEPDRNAINGDGADVCVVNVSVRDSKGREIPDASNLVQFEVRAGGRIIGVGNGDPGSHEPDKYLAGNYRRKLFNGKCQVIVQADQTGSPIILEASSASLPQTGLTIQKLH